MVHRRILRSLIPVAAIAITVWPTASRGQMAQPLLRASSLNPRVGQTIELLLNLPSRDAWPDANIGLLIVRVDGQQRSIPVQPKQGKESLDLKFDQAGYVMIAMSAGPAPAKGHSDSWQRTPYCCKLVLRVDSADAKASTEHFADEPGIVGKVGQKIEILPLINPATLRVGDDLPVRVYYEGGKIPGAAVQAMFMSQIGPLRPANVISRTTDAVGTAWFPISQKGRWIVRMEHQVEGVTYVAELVFDIALERAEGINPDESNSGGKQ